MPTKRIPSAAVLEAFDKALARTTEIESSDTNNPKYDRNATLAKIKALTPGWGGAVPNAVVLMYIRGWQTGTIHQLASDLGTTSADILAADYDRMLLLMRLAQIKYAEEIVRKIDAAMVKRRAREGKI